VAGDGVRVKICGVCRPRDAAAAAAAGADYIGVVLAPGLRRSRSLDEAAAIWAAAPGPLRVGVFVDGAEAELRGAGESLGLAVLQLHGREPPELLAAVRGGGWEVWKALRPRSAAELEAAVAAYAPVADGLVVDGWSAAGPGGAGAVFDWGLLERVRFALPGSLRLVVAGGLAPTNVAEAIERLRPDVVDVSSGVERAPCEKDPERVAAFVAAARSAAACLGRRAAREQR